jgi:hypothetical protein
MMHPPSDGSPSYGRRVDRPALPIGQVLEIRFPAFTPRITIHSGRER